MPIFSRAAKHAFFLATSGVRTLAARASVTPVHSSNYRDLAFGPVVTDKTKEEALVKRMSQLESRIQTSEAQLSFMREQLDQSQREYYQSREPFVQSEDAFNRIKKIEQTIFEGIYHSALMGLNKVNFQPEWGYHPGLISFFNQILTSYDMRASIECFRGCQEITETLTIYFPDTYTVKTLPYQSGNATYNAWLTGFDMNIQSAYTKAEDKIKADFTRLKSEVYAPIANGDLQSFSKFSPCPAAFARFKIFADENNINISMHGKIITAELKLAEENLSPGRVMC